MKQLMIFLLFVAVRTTAQTQDTISLFDCYKEAISNFPSSKEKGYLTEASSLNSLNIKSNWYPRLDFKTQATLQSDVTSIGIDFLPLAGPDGPIIIKFPKPDKDQYKGYIEFSQLLFDGGLTKAQQVLERTNLSVNTKQVDVELNKLKERVSKIYFSILYSQKQQQILRLMDSELTDRMKALESTVKNGTGLQSNLNILLAEKLKIEQQIKEFEINVRTSKNILTQLTGLKFEENTEVSVPNITMYKSDSVNLPEDELFDSQVKAADDNSKLLKKERLPKVYCFGQTGYGKPALNQFKSQFDFYYYIGINMHWNIYDWNINRRKKQVLGIQKEIIKTRKETFHKNLEILLQADSASIDKFEELIETDKKIIDLRKSISQNAKFQLDNGVITSTSFIIELNAEIQALINLEIHKIQLVESKVNYLTRMGVFN